MTNKQLPPWIIAKCKDYADDNEQWLPYLELVMSENERLYGDPLPPQDPQKEAKRKRAVRHQRVLDTERFYE